MNAGIGRATLLVVCCAAFSVAQQPTFTPEVHRAARERWQLSGRVGSNAASLRRQALEQKLSARKGQARVGTMSTSGTGPGWVSLGPLPLPSDASGSGIQDYGWVTGRVTALALDPNDVTGNTVFVGGAYGGVWKSTNAGSSSVHPGSVSWSPLTDDQLTLAIGALAVQPQNSSPDPNHSIVLAGTGETNSSADSYYGLGILRSVDGGAHWTLISQDAAGTHSFAGIGFSQIAFSSSNPNLVVAAAASAPEGMVDGLENRLGANRGLYYSLDAGTTWNIASIKDSGSSIIGASATSVVFNVAARKFYAALRHHGFYSSSDGANWTRLPAQPGPGLTPAACPPQVAQPNICPIYRGVLAVTPNHTGPAGLGEMYLWFVDDNDRDQGIWTLSNSGTVWTPIDDSGITHCGDFFGGCGTVQGSYNLALTAVPNGAATDLYAGTTNIYKCTIVPGSSACNGAGRNTFLNLTHVYGCSDIARVHPNQHAIDFLVANGTSLMYFANDGGVYRALDGFTGLSTGSCGFSNQFDNLNATLGPLTQFESLAQSATDINLLWGGTQGNGAPATQFLQSGGQWLNVNAGDVGWTAISPTDDSEWFLSVPPDTISGVNVLRCGSGVNCHTQDFQNDPIVSSTSVGGDSGPFYLPFKFDPANATTMLVGTCRIWRGSSSGGSFSLLSPNFEVGGYGTCNGTETNMIRTLAIGGPRDPLGNSQVIYAATNGEGPAIAPAPLGGRVWVSSNASGGLPTWADVTGSINPQGFPISSIVLDPRDPSGQTAYAAIMGFHTAHVWKTISAGLWWFDFTGNLPDAPVNALVVDPSAAMIYAGTDVGVFASGTSDPNWTELGPQPGQAGFLPNVAITSLQLFNSGTSNRLRAGTYGRGIWEFNLVSTPDFQISVSNSQQTIFAGQSATFTGTLQALNAYASRVALACAAGSTPPPQNCSVSPGNVIPTVQGSGFTVTAGDLPGDYLFALQANGADPASITHAAPLVLHVVDFSLGAPAPSAVTLARGTTGAPVTLAVAAAGAFAGTVTLSCGSLPAGITCQFQPASVAPTVANPVTVTLIVGASSTAALGSFQLAIGAVTPGVSAKTQSLSITVTSTPDYALIISNRSLTARVNATATFTGTLAGLNGYSSSVNLGCGSGAPTSCTVTPGTLIPTPGGAPFTVAVSSNVAQAYSFNLNAIGTDVATTAHSLALNFTAMPNAAFDFSISATPSTRSVPRGQPALFSVAMNPNTGSYPNNVSLDCSGLPTLSSCSFDPAQVLAGSGNSVVTVRILTTAASSRAALLLALPLLVTILVPLDAKGRQKILRTLLLTTLAFGGAACGGGLQGNGGGGGGSSGTKPGNYIVTITATCGTVAHSTAVTLTVTQ